MSNVVLINVSASALTYHPIHPKQIPSEQVQSTHHNPDAVDKSKLNFLLLNPTTLILILTHNDISIKADILLLILSNYSNSGAHGFRIKLLPQLSNEQMQGGWLRNCLHITNQVGRLPSTKKALIWDADRKPLMGAE